MLKSHFKPLLGIFGFSIMCGFIDYGTSDRTADFHLAPGFDRSVDIVNTKRLSEEIPRKWNCSSQGKGFLFLDETPHTLTLEEHLNESFQITVKSNIKDPVIIIMASDKTILACEDSEFGNLSTLR